MSQITEENVTFALAPAYADERLFDGSMARVTVDNVHKLEVKDNRVGGNAQVFQNGGGAYVSRNLVDGNLQCKENRPAPRGGGNRVDGNREDQCRQL